VCVVGGGPAGALYATLARLRGRSVVLVADGRVTKAGAETISAEAARLLREAGLGWCLEASGAVRSSGTIDTWTGSPGRVRRASIASAWGCAWHVDRTRLDASLRRAAGDAGVLLVRGPVAAASAVAGGFRIAAVGVTIACREVVDATGAAARVGRWLGVRRVVVDRQVVVFAHLSRPLPEPALVVASFAHGWVYLTADAARRTQVAVVTDAPVLRAQGAAAVLRQALDAAGVAAAPETFTSARVAGAPMQFLDGPWPAAFCAIGDAAWTPDPLSGHGVARALHAAARLAAGSPATEPSPAPRVLAHLRERSRWYAATPWAHEPYYQNRLRAHARAEETWHDHSMAVD
jgi:flavin-dependent dehydrogenase